MLSRFFSFQLIPYITAPLKTLTVAQLVNKFVVPEELENSCLVFIGSCPMSKIQIKSASPHLLLSNTFLYKPSIYA